MGGGIEGELKTNSLLLLPVPKPEKEYDLDLEILLKKPKENTEKIESIVGKTYGLSDLEIKFISSSVKL